jgi:hypothetical protein
MQHPQFNEGMEQGDLTRLVFPSLHIDEFKSKLGRDSDVCVLSFKLDGKEPALDLMGFFEKGYSFILDSDTSGGEMPDGDYIVFVEIERTAELPGQIHGIMQDLMNLTEQSLDDWTVRYQKDGTDYDLTEQVLGEIIPLSREQYNRKFGKSEIDRMKAAAGVKIDTKAPKNEMTEQLRRWAGII